MRGNKAPQRAHSWRVPFALAGVAFQLDTLRNVVPSCSSILMSRRRFPVLIGSGLILCLASTSSSVYGDAIICQRAVAKGAAQLARTIVRAQQKCDDAALSGLSGDPCPNIPTVVAIGKAETKLRTTLNIKCGGPDRSCGTGVDESLNSIGWGSGVCPG